MSKVINTDELAKNLQLVYDILKRRADVATDAAVRSQSPIIAEKADAYQTAAFLLDGFCSSAGLFLKNTEPVKSEPVVINEKSEPVELSTAHKVYIYKMEENIV